MSTETSSLRMLLISYCATKLKPILDLTLHGTKQSSLLHNTTGDFHDFMREQCKLPRVVL